MILHISIPARNPRAAADVLARILDASVFSFPVVSGGFVVVSRDGSGTAIEVVPETAAHHLGAGEPDASMPPNGPQPMPWEVQIRHDGRTPAASATHAALTTKLSAREVLALGRSQGWRSLECERAGVFGVIELWIDDRFLVEVLPEEQAARYLAFFQPAVCAGMFGAPLSWSEPP